MTKTRRIEITIETHEVSTIHQSRRSGSESSAIYTALASTGAEERSDTASGAEPLKEKVDDHLQALNAAK